MGGHEGGALAAQAVADVTEEQFEAQSACSPDELLAEIVSGAHERINALGVEQGLSPHSTCVLLHLTDNKAHWAHVGDSRLYCFREGRVEQRTLDHSIVELMRLKGDITEEEMKTHPDQNRLYEALGGQQSPRPDFGSKPLSPNAGFLLASDGVWENVGDNQLESVLAATDLSASLLGLIEAAKSKGGEGCDNLAAIVCRYRDRPDGTNWDLSTGRGGSVGT